MTSNEYPPRHDQGGYGQGQQGGGYPGNPDGSGSYPPAPAFQSYPQYDHGYSRGVPARCWLPR